MARFTPVTRRLILPVLGKKKSTLLKDLKLYLKLGETGAADRVDSSGHALDFAATGAPSNGAGKSGDALAAEAGKYLTRAYDSKLAFHLGDWLLSFWYNLTTYEEAKVIYGQWGAAYSFCLWFYQTFPSPITSPGGIRYFDRMDAIAGDIGAYHHLLFWWDSGAGLLWAMKDNKNLQSFAQASFDANIAYGFGVGDRYPGGSAFTGLIDELAFWQRKPTADEIAWLYNNGAGNFYPFTTPTITQKQIICDGDSLTQGYSQVSYAESYPGQLDADYSGIHAVRNVGDSGHAVASGAANSLIDDAPAKFDWLYSTVYAKNILVFWGGINDIVLLDRSAATVYADIVTYCQARQAIGWQIAICTLTPSQYTGQPADTQTRINTINTNIRNNYTNYADALVDLAVDPSLDDPTDSTYFNADKLHLKAAGLTVVERLVKTAVNLL